MESIGPQFNYRLRLTREYTADYFSVPVENIKIIMLDIHATAINFIPKIHFEEWPPLAPLNEAGIQSKNDVLKVFLMAFARGFIITPCEKWAGEARVLKYDHLQQYRSIEKDIVVFFLMEEEYHQFEEQAISIGNRKENGESCLVYDLQNDGFKIAFFIENKIVNSPFLTDYELLHICRKRDEKGNIVRLE